MSSVSNTREAEEVILLVEDYRCEMLSRRLDGMEVLGDGMMGVGMVSMSIDISIALPR